MTFFLRNSIAYPVGWHVVAAGLRKAQDVGAHRKKMYRGKASVDGELWKRAFWFLALFDVFGSVSLGRSCCTSEEECVDFTSVLLQELKFIVTTLTCPLRLMTSIGRPATLRRHSNSPKAYHLRYLRSIVLSS
jgi:hypothetical protein